MNIKDIINFLNPTKRAWWNTSEWIQQNWYAVHEIIEDNSPCSWDVKTYKIIHYKHKKSCEERVRVKEDPYVGETVFDHPDESLDSTNIEKVDVYEGPKYE